MGSMVVTFWAGCKKEDVSAFAEAENIAPFKGKAMTITAAKAHYEKTQKALRGISFRSGEGDVDWETAVIDTAANGQVEVIAPVKGWQYAGTDGRKWAINTKFEYDENGNPVGNYAIVINDIGNTSVEWATFSGTVMYFGMDKKYQEGYKYNNGISIPLYESSDSTATSGEYRWFNITRIDDNCYEMCEVAVAKTSGNNPSNSGAKGSTQPNQISDVGDCVGFCRFGTNNGGSSGFGGSGGSNGGGVATGGTYGGGSGGGTSNGTNTSNLTLYDQNLLRCHNYMQAYPLPLTDQMLHTYITNAIAQGYSYASFTQNNKITQTVVRNILSTPPYNMYNFTTTQLNYLETKPALLSQMFMGLGEGQNMSVTAFREVLHTHLDRCHTDGAYASRNAEQINAYPLPMQRYPLINSPAFWRIGWNSNTIFPLFLSIPSNITGFSAAQMTYLQANKRVAWQVAEYLRVPQVISPGGGNDPYVVEYAEKVEEMQALMELFMDNPDLAQANADAYYPTLHSDGWWDTIAAWWNANIEPYNNQYKTLNQAEKNVVKGNPGASYKILNRKKIATAKIKALCPNTWPRNNNADAFVHSYWCALSARDAGWAITKMFTDAHESLYINHPTLAIESQMDLHNNQIGINIGVANPNATDAQIATLLINAIQNGEMWRINNVNYNLTGPQFEATGGLQPNSALIASGGGLCN